MSTYARTRPSWTVMRSISSAVSFSRPSRATFATSSRVSRPVIVLLQRGRQRERFPHDGLRDASAANALRAHAAPDHRSPLLHLDSLQVRAELAARNPRRLSAVAAQVLGFAAL